MTAFARDSLVRTYTRLKNPISLCEYGRAVVYNPVENKFIITSVDGKAYHTAMNRGRVVGVFDFRVDFESLWEDCEFVFRSFYPSKPFNFTRLK